MIYLFIYWDMKKWSSKDMPKPFEGRGRRKRHGGGGP